MNTIILSAANAFTAEEERWLNNDTEIDTSLINEGRLNFITKPTKKDIFRSITNLKLTQHSIDTGWVELEQCYFYLDKLPELTINYQYRFIKNLRVKLKRSIDESIIKGQSIILKNISDNAEFCISAEVRIFYQNEDSSFSLTNGPYHRQFLDGYYPYHLTLTILYPAKSLTLRTLHPRPQTGFLVKTKPGQITIDTYFEGRLQVDLNFILRRQ